MLKPNTLRRLSDYWVVVYERAGLILKDHSIVELRNVHERPQDGFIIQEKEWKPYEDQIIATWHTHPRTSANLSATDWRMFLAHPNWLHYIISRDTIRAYVVREEKVLIYEEDCLRGK